MGEQDLAIYEKDGITVLLHENGLTFIKGDSKMFLPNDFLEDSQEELGKAAEELNRENPDSIWVNREEI